MKRLTLKEVYLREEPERQVLEDNIVDRLFNAANMSQRAAELIMQTNNAIVAREALQATQTLNKLYNKFLNGDY